MRTGGRSYQEIADHLGLSKARAHQLVHEAIKDYPTDASEELYVLMLQGLELCIAPCVRRHDDAGAVAGHTRSCLTPGRHCEVTSGPATRSVSSPGYLYEVGRGGPVGWLQRCSHRQECVRTQVHARRDR